MKRLIALGAVALVAAAPASAATPTQRIAKLEAQVATLTKQVKTLQTRERFDRSEIGANYTGDACLAATMADLFQSTWATIDQGAAGAEVHHRAAGRRQGRLQEPAGRRGHGPGSRLRRRSSR